MVQTDKIIAHKKGLEAAAVELARIGEFNQGFGMGRYESPYALIKLLKTKEDSLMDSARVSKRPKSDNNYGRVAMKLKEAREALQNLPW